MTIRRSALLVAALCGSIGASPTRAQTGSLLPPSGPAAPDQPAGKTPIPPAPPAPDQQATPNPVTGNTSSPDSSSPTAPADSREAGTILPAPAPKATVAPVVHIYDVPKADWRSLSLFAARTKGLTHISRSFLTQFFARENCSAWQRDQNDDFKMEDHRTALKAQLATERVVKRVRVPLPIRLENFDFDLNGFPLPANYGIGTRLSIPTNAGCGLGASGSGGPDDIPYSYTLTFSEAVPWPPVLPVIRERGREITAALPGDRTVRAEIVVDLLGFDPTDNGAISTIQVRPVAILVWIDEHERKFIGMAGAVQPGAELPEVESISPPRPVSVPPSPGPAAPITAPPETTIEGLGELGRSGKLLVAGRSVPLFGIERLSPLQTPAGKGFNFWLHSKGSLTCHVRQADEFQCIVTRADGAQLDVADAALLGGAAMATSDAPPRYTKEQDFAKAKHKGMWP